MSRKNSARRACAFSLAAATGLALPVGVAVRAGAATSAPTITASASSYILSATHNPTVTIKAHVVDPKGAQDVEAQWQVPRTVHPATAEFSLTAGTTADGTWTATIPIFDCNPVWTMNVVEYETGSDVANAKTSLSVLTVSDLPDTTPPGSFTSVSDPAPVYVGKPTIPTQTTAAVVTAAPGSGVEFWSELTDSAQCGQVSSGTKSVTVTAAPQSNPAATVTAQLHLAIDLTNPSAFGLHWAGTLKLPTNAASGPWTYYAVAADNAGNVSPHLGQIGTLLVSP